MQVVVFTDGGSRGNPGEAAVGGVVLAAETGEVLHEYAQTIGVATNNEAEYQSVIHVLTWLSENASVLTVTEISFKLDSMLVVEQLQKHWKIKDDRMRALAQQCWQLLDKLNLPHSFRHVPRAENKLADALVNQALDSAKV